MEVVVCGEPSKCDAFMIGGAQGYAVAVAEFVGGGPQQLDRRAPEELSEQDVERLDFLIKEAVRLTQGIALRKSSSFLQFQNTNMETMVEEKALRPHWRSCLVILLAPLPLSSFLP